MSNQIVDAQEQTEEVKQESRAVRAIKAVETEEDLSQFEQDIQTMSVDELNQIIDHVAVEGRQRGTTRSSSLKAAWKVAATIARNVGFPHAATLVEHSVDGRNYTEKMGAFHRPSSRQPRIIELRIKMAAVAIALQRVIVQIYFMLSINSHIHLLEVILGSQILLILKQILIIKMDLQHG